MKHIIWSNYGLDYEDWREELEEQFPDYSEEERWMFMYDLNAEDLECERMNLNIPLGIPILCIADLGLWNGRHSGYAEIRSGNIKDCLVYHGDSAEFYVEDGEFKCDQYHHDGTNYLTYRVWKRQYTQAFKDRLLDKLYEGNATQEDIDKYTKPLGSVISKVYGWKED